MSPGNKERWFAANLTRMVGILRLGSHAMVITSGLGIGAEGSVFRLLTGILGTSGGLTLALSKKPPQHSQKDQTLPRNVVERAAILFMLAGISLLISGIVKHRLFESIAGALAAIAFCIQWRVTEHGQKPTGTKRGRNLIAYYKGNPMALSSDMLQTNAAWVLCDALINQDIPRTISGCLLATSNLLMRQVKKREYDSL